MSRGLVLLLLLLLLLPQRCQALILYHTILTMIPNDIVATAT